MDSYGTVLLVVMVTVIVLAVVGFWLLSKRGPRGAVLVVAIFLLVFGQTIQPVKTREAHAVVGTLKLAGFIGTILGLFDMARRKPDRWERR